MTHEAQPSAEYHEDEPAVPRKLFNIENFTPVDVEQFLIATTYVENAAMEAWNRHKISRHEGINGDALGQIGGIFYEELKQLPALDLEKAEAVFAQLVASEQVTSREAAADIVDSLAEQQVTDSERLQQTIDLWCRMMIDENNDSDNDGVISQAAQESAGRALDDGLLPLAERQRLYDALEAQDGVWRMARPS